MTTAEIVAPNTVDGAAQQHNAVPSLDSISQKMTAMRENAQRNRQQATGPTETGSSEQANTEAPVAPESAEQSVEPEVAATEEDITAATDNADTAQTEESVSTADSDTTAQEVIDFLEFAETNPQARFKFMKNGKEVIIDAKKAAAILGQGGAIHEEARELKVKKAEFDEYEQEQRARHEGLTLAMEFTIEPKLKQAYDEIVRTQNYQTTFAQQLQATQDAAQQARIRASMEQNERYIQQQTQVISSLRPQVDQFRHIRQQQVQSILENNRRNFSDKELKNSYVYNEVREKVSKNWRDAEGELIPGVKNIDLISSDEHILGLLRDGLKFRDRPAAKTAGASIAALQGRKGTGVNTRSADQEITELRDRAKSGDKKAADNLLVAQLNRLRSTRSR
jgi:hypothetical protein